MSSSFCRLCAKIKSQRSLKTTINDPSACIKKKLIDCCRWNSFTDDEKLPQHVCNSCIKKLEQSWEFAEIIATSQTVLYKMIITESNEKLPNVVDKKKFDAKTFDEKNCDATFNVVDVKVKTEVESETNNMNQTNKLTQPEEQSQSSDNSELLDHIDNFTKNDCIENIDSVCSVEVDVVKFEEDEFLSNLSKEVCNSDGSITDEGVLKLKLSSWNDYQHKCTECNTISKGVNRYRFHVESKHPNESTPLQLLCTDCPKKYSRYGSFATHVATEHRHHLKYCCYKCQKFFWNFKLLKRHLYNHQYDGRKYKCQTCGKSYSRKSHLKGHFEVHLPTELQNEFVCDYCDRSFLKKETIRAHMLIHSGQRQHTCEQCGRSFTQKANLQNHIITHTTDKPFDCDLCSKRFKLLTSLNKHKRTHTDIKPHQCNTCGKKFRTNCNLKVHMRIHSGALPYACDYCGKKFRTTGVLIIHKRGHTGERPYSCSVHSCQHQFTNWSNYNKHMKVRHGIDTSTREKKSRMPTFQSRRIES